MTETPTTSPPSTGAADYAILALVCVVAAFAGLIEVLLVPLYAGGTIVPITVLLGAATTYAAPKLGVWLIGATRGAVLPVASWLIAVLALGFRPGADVVVQGGNGEQWVMFALVIAGAVVGFGTVLHSSVPAPKPLAATTTR